MRQVDPRLALIRHAISGDAEPPRVSPLQRRKSRALQLPEVSDDARAEYAYAFAEREGLKIDGGMVGRCGSKLINPDCCAYHSTLLEIGCLEFFDHATALPYVRGLVRATLPAVASIACPRCESVGHVVEACPFWLNDEAVTKIARLRRERRAGREAAA